MAVFRVVVFCHFRSAENSADMRWHLRPPKVRRASAYLRESQGLAATVGAPEIWYPQLLFADW